jgi:2-aminobenzoate-CoA ligase
MFRRADVKPESLPWGRLRHALVVDKHFNDVPRGTVGRLAVRGPTGCRYLADARQQEYVQNGWNVTGDAFSQDDDGYFRFAARNDDMIISAGYNIAGPEVLSSRHSHHRRRLREGGA